MEINYCNGRNYRRISPKLFKGQGICASAFPNKTFISLNHTLPGFIKSGSEPPPIQKEENVIVDGHHRYISGCLFGSIPKSVEVPRPKANEICSWKDLIIDSQDFGDNFDLKK